MTRKTAIIFEAVGGNPRRDRVEIGADGDKIVVVAIGDPGELIRSAKDLAGSGVELIELCGGISPTGRAEVKEAVGTQCRVSSVTFGIESLAAAGRYSAAYEAGERTKEAFILLSPGAARREPLLFGGTDPRTSLVTVANAHDAPGVAEKLVDDGVQLIELYGGFGTDAIAAVLRAVDGRAAVGAGSFAIDELPD